MSVFLEMMNMTQTAAQRLAGQKKRSIWRQEVTLPDAAATTTKRTSDLASRI